MFGKSLLATTVALCLSASGALAGVIASGPFPAKGDLYSSATNGSGTISAGGQSAFMWTAGDYVQSSGASVIGSYAATSFTDTFTINNLLGNGNVLTVDALLDGINIGSWTADDCGFCGSNQVINFTANFAPIVVSGPFTVEYVLANTIPGGGGSIAFLDGGDAALYGTALGVPEPFTLSIFGVGLAGAIVTRRRKKAA
ncbi:MAG TPA: PEP-CTERM sorting domain-containing protein [Rhizomicrobium sp.]|nr:PEP-CTERM sorting domain-containing protein [Rhizomicrobium sp.]